MVPAEVGCGPGAGRPGTGNRRGLGLAVGGKGVRAAWALKQYRRQSGKGARGERVRGVAPERGKQEGKRDRQARQACESG